MPITSGCHVTPMWNLYLQPAVELLEYSLSVLDSFVHPKTSESKLTLKAAFTCCLSDILFLPKGGCLGFGLCQEYLLDPDVGLGNLIDCLQGSDTIVKSVCCQLSLRTSLQIIYYNEDGDNFSMINCFINFLAWEPVKVISCAIENEGGRFIHTPKPVTLEGNHYQSLDESPLVWVMDLTKYMHMKRAYLAYENESSLGYAYCTVCLMVHIGPFGSRTANIEKPVVEAKNYHDC